MKRRFFAFLLAWLLCLPLCPSGFAEEEAFAYEKPSSRLRALLIGCDHFISQPDTWPAAESNLRLLSDALAADSRRYDLIRSYSGNLATVEAFEEAVINAFQGAQGQDISLLYISTHGIFDEKEDNARAGLLLSDGEMEEVLDAPNLQRILDQISGVKMVILDACNSGAVIGKGLSDCGLHAFLTGADYKVLCSAGGSEASWYFQGGVEPAVTGASYFATVLSNGLGAQGDFAADWNADGLITLAEAYAFLRDNYAASTPQTYPQNDDEFVLFSYDPDLPRFVQKAVTDITFEETLLTAGQSEVSFSFTMQRQAELYYQIIYHQDGAWQFDQAQHFLDGEQADGTVLPGRKARTLTLNTGADAFGYAMIQLITLENEKPVFQGARLLCVQPAQGEVRLNVITAPSFVPGAGQELSILVRHDVPCGLTVSILNEDGTTVRRLSYEAPSRPQQLSPAGTNFYWDGCLNHGEAAPPGKYTVQVKARLGMNSAIVKSEPFLLAAPEEAAPEADASFIVAE